MKEDQYVKQLQKRYNDYLRNIITTQSFETILLVGGKERPENTRELHERIQLFQKNEKTHNSNGWLIEWREWSSKKFGKQQWPETIRVTTEEDFLYLLGKQKEVNDFRNQLRLMLEWNNNIAGWLTVQPNRVLELRYAWGDISAVIDYLLTNEVSCHYIRSLPVPVHTKFISKHENIILSLLKYLAPGKINTETTELTTALNLRQKQFIYPMRWLDPFLADQYTHGMEIMGVTVEGLRKLAWEIDAVCMVENETNLYLLPQVKGMMAVFSWGKALSLLREVPLLQQTRLFYWGDLDDDGFHMLNNFRQHYPNLKSLLMDLPTVNFHSAEMRTQPIPYRKASLPFLFPEEQAAYKMLSAVQGRIEQEQLQQQYIQRVLQTIVS